MPVHWNPTSRFKLFTPDPAAFWAPQDSPGRGLPWPGPQRRAWGHSRRPAGAGFQEPAAAGGPSCLGRGPGAPLGPGCHFAWTSGQSDPAGTEPGVWAGERHTDTHRPIRQTQTVPPRAAATTLVPSAFLSSPCPACPPPCLPGPAPSLASEVLRKYWLHR